MTFVCVGIGVTQQIAVGDAYLLQREGIEVLPRFIEQDQVPQEVDRYLQALAGVRRALRAVRERIPESTRSDIAAFIDTHLLMLDDATLAKVPIKHIREKRCAAEWALQLQRDALAEIFKEIEDPYLSTRMDDVDHVVNQIQKRLLQKAEPQLEDLKGKIIIAQDLAPADTILFRHHGIAGFITESGGPMSHTAILARSLGIPAVVGVRHATHSLLHGEQLVVDGRQGMLFATSDERILLYYRHLIRTSREHAISLRRLIREPAVTTDGESVKLMANIELPEDIEATRSLAADGVGLYRTEYLYMNRTTPPDEEEQFNAYRQAVDSLGGIPITIRTLDLGADKQINESISCQSTCCNPALGLRAIRLCLKVPKLFRPQLRAILRVSAFGPVQIMIPMLSNLQEVHQLKAILQETKNSLHRDGLAFDPAIKVGGMIEVPAAALAADAFARDLDFLSIGTNDLIQYTLAIDRIDDSVNYLYDPLHPSVLRLIKMVIEASEQHAIPVGMCGEMAGDPRYIPLLLGMGLRQFSMQPGSLLEAKSVLRSLAAAPLTRQITQIMPRVSEPGTRDLLLQICNLPDLQPY